MKTAVLFAAMVLLFACARPSPKFAGLVPAHGKAEAAWNECLNRAPSLKTHRQAIVRSVRGEVTLSANDGRTWKPARVGERVSEGDLIQTDLYLADNGPVLRLPADSRLRIVRLASKQTNIEKVIDTMLELEKGKIFGSVKKMGAASSYMLRTPVGVVCVRGAEFSAGLDGYVGVLSGRVVVLMREKEVILKDFQECAADANVKALKPLDAVDIQSKLGPVLIGPI